MTGYVILPFVIAVSGCGAMSGQEQLDASDPAGEGGPSDGAKDDAATADGPEAALPGWHWEDANGVFVTDEDSLGFVDDRGLFWYIDPLIGRPMTPYRYYEYFDGAECRSWGGITGHPGILLTPFSVLGRDGYFFLSMEIEFPTQSLRLAESAFLPTTLAANGECVAQSSGTVSLYSLEDFTYDEDLEPPDVRFTPPFVRVRD